MFLVLSASRPDKSHVTGAQLKREKRVMQRGANLSTTNCVKVAAALALTALLLMVGAESGVAGAQEGVPESGASGSPPKDVGEDSGARPPEIEASSWALVDADSGLY